MHEVLRATPALHKPGHRRIKSSEVTKGLFYKVFALLYRHNRSAPTMPDLEADVSLAPRGQIDGG